MSLFGAKKKRLEEERIKKKNKRKLEEDIIKKEKLEKARLKKEKQRIQEFEILKESISKKNGITIIFSCPMSRGGGLNEVWLFIYKKQPTISTDTYEEERNNCEELIMKSNYREEMVMNYTHLKKLSDTTRIKFLENFSKESMRAIREVRNRLSIYNYTVTIETKKDIIECFTVSPPSDMKELGFISITRNGIPIYKSNSMNSFDILYCYLNEIIINYVNEKRSEKT